MRRSASSTAWRVGEEWRLAKANGGGRRQIADDYFEETTPDIVCLQELKTDDSKFPARAIAETGYEAIWHGQRAHHGVAILARGEKPIELRRGLPGDSTDTHTRYLEANVKGLVVASVYRPNGNPVPSANFDYKLRWFERFNAHASKLSTGGHSVVLAGDLNVIPTDFDIYNPWWWRFDASCNRIRAQPLNAYLRRDGQTPHARYTPVSGCIRTGLQWKLGARGRDFVSISCSSVRH